MPECPLPLTVKEFPGRVRLRLGRLAYGEGPTLQDAADDLLQRLLTYVMAFRAAGIQPSRELAPPDLATMDFSTNSASSPPPVATSAAACSADHRADHGWIDSPHFPLHRRAACPWMVA
jgi:hypothetical protein